MNFDQQGQLDALGDPTRRAIVERLFDGPKAVADLARGFPVSRPAISHHLRILKEANLVSDEAVGTRRLYRLNPHGFDLLRDCLDRFWSLNLDAVKKKLEETEEEEMTTQTIAPVHRTISVRAGADRAFRVFTEGIQGWWPSEHHIGNAPAKKAAIEGHVGGRCYTEHVDGSESIWGRVMVWEPPQRFVMAWLIDANWKHDPDPSRTSEVEVRFTPQADGTTRVDLEHRNFERMGEGGSNMQMMVGSENGWNGLLKLFADYAEKGDTQ
jgi:DNA-binding transcriptional ArsR family regulator/uncharacterized protein YndB with AHSA1/START domain